MNSFNLTFPLSLVLTLYHLSYKMSIVKIKNLRKFFITEKFIYILLFLATEKINNKINQFN